MVIGPSLTSSTSISAPKMPRSTATPAACQRVGESLVERLAEGRRRGVEERWAAALAGVAVERELADDERRSADVDEAQVGLALGVAEDAQVRDAPGQGLGPGFVVVVTDADQDHQAGADPSDDLALDRHGRTSDALEQQAHGILRVGWLEALG